MPMNKREVVAIIRSILSSMKHPITISTLNKEFRDETGVDIPHFGYKNISNFLHSLTDTVKLTGLYPIEKVSLIPNEKSGHIKGLVDQQNCCARSKKKSSSGKKSKHSARCRNRRARENERAAREREESVVPERVWPKNSFCISERVPLIDLNFYVTVGKHTDIHVLEIISPYNFYFQLRKFKFDLFVLMNDFQMFYETEDQIPRVKKNLIRVKQNCAAFHVTDEGGRWYRAEILGLLDESHVKIFLIDYGQFAEVSVKNLKLLHQNFASLPRQAFLGFLANIKPRSPRGRWSFDAVQRFTDIALLRDLVAGIVHINARAYAVGMTMASAKGQEIDVNDTLVKEGHARFETFSSNECEQICAANRFSEIDRIKDLTDKSVSVDVEVDFEKLSIEEKRKEISRKYSFPKPPKEEPKVFYFPVHMAHRNERLKKLFSDD